MKMRLQKILAQAGVASRRKAEEYIVQGRVMVNGKVIKELGVQADPDDDFVAVDGKRVQIFHNFAYIILHKPTGYITSLSDERDRPVVMDLIHHVKEPLIPVGRLDWDSSGLLLLTNDGDLAYVLTHPAFHVPKTYMVRLDKPMTKEQMAAFERGVRLEDGVTKPAKIKRVNTGNQKATPNVWYEVTITEGRNRQVRKMFEAMGFDVRKLKRVSMGEILLGGVGVGKYRRAESWEVEYFEKLKREKLNRKKS